MRWWTQMKLFSIVLLAIDCQTNGNSSCLYCVLLWFFEWITLTCFIVFFRLIKSSCAYQLCLCSQHFLLRLISTLHVLWRCLNIEVEQLGGGLDKVCLLVCVCVSVCVSVLLVSLLVCPSVGLFLFVCLSLSASLPACLSFSVCISETHILCTHWYNNHVQIFQLTVSLYSCFWMQNIMSAWIILFPLPYITYKKSMYPQILVHLLERRPWETCEDVFGELHEWQSSTIREGTYVEMSDLVFTGHEVKVWKMIQWTSANVL